MEYFTSTQAQNKCLPKGAAARNAKLWRAIRRHWNNQKYGACTLRFPHEKDFLENIHILVGNLEGRRKLRKRRCKWENNINTYL